MENYFYANLDESNIVTGIMSLSSEMHFPEYVRVDSYNPELIGKLYKNGSFVTSPKEAEKLTYIISVGEFHSRFSIEEKATLYNAAVNDVKIKMFLDDLISASVIDLSNVFITHIMNHMVTNELLSEKRKEEILSPKQLSI